MFHAKGQVLGRTWSLSCLKRSLPVLEDDECLVASKRRRKLGIGDDMEPRIWRNFPGDLIELVLARLPAVTLIRFRSVCKEWNSMLTDTCPSSFSSRHPLLGQSQHPWFYILSGTRGDDERFASVYDPCSNKWYHPTLPCLPTTRKFLTPVGSVGGLICFVDTYHHGRFYVCNPITRSCKELPPLDCYQRSSIGNHYAVNGNSNSYAILCLDPTNGFLSLYKSCDNSWTSIPVLAPSDDIQLLWVPSTSALYSMGTFHFMTSYDMLVSYEFATGATKEFYVPLPVSMLSHRVTVSDQGKIILSGLVTIGESTEHKYCCIWEMQTMIVPQWKRVAHLCVEYCNDGMTCFGAEGDLIMLGLEDTRTSRPWHVIYDFKTREWLNVPSSVQEPHKELGGTAFQPCLFALP